MLNMLSSRDSILAEFPGKTYKEREKPWLEKKTQVHTKALQLTFRGKDTLQIPSHDVIQQRQIRFFRFTLRALIVRSRNRS